MDNYKDSAATTGDFSISYFCKVNTPELEGHQSLAYDEYIDAHLNRWYARVIKNIEDAEKIEDKKYRYTVAKRDLLGILRDVPSIREQVHYHPEEKENPISAFVFETVSRRLANLLMDLEKRFPRLTEETYSEENIYLKMLDRKPIEPSPHQLTTTWYNKKMQDVLSELVKRNRSDLSVVDEAADLVYGLHLILTEKSAHDEDYRPFLKLLHHLENAFFLWLMEASFMDGHPKRLREANFCREWVQQMIRGLLAGDDEVSPHKRIQQLIEVRLTLSEYEYLFGNNVEWPVSAARQWLLQVDQLANGAGMGTVPGVAEPAEEAMNNKGQKEVNHLINDFVRYFQTTYVHKKDVERVMGIGNRTIRNYLEMSDTTVRKIKIKQNEWFLQEDLRHLLDEFLE